MSPDKMAFIVDSTGGGGQDASTSAATATAATLNLFSSSPPPPLDVDSLKNAEEIKLAFKQLNEEEERVDKELEAILGGQTQLEAKLRSLNSAAPTLRSTQGEAKKLSSVISFTAKLAEGVSAKVKQLDLAKSRVSDCQQRVNDLIDLKLCSDGVKAALNEEDYEQAAAHLHRFLAMDEGLLKLTASEVGAATEGDENGFGVGFASLDAALRTLHEAEATVKEVVAVRFEEAVRDEDLASIERFFKIFPLINMHEDGLGRFTRYLCSKVAAAAADNLKQAGDTSVGDKRADVVFADALTLLFEGIARTIEIHQPLIETYYGPGRLLTVAQMLQVECDKQAKKIFELFRKKRGVAEKVEKVREALVTSASMSSLASSANLAAAAQQKNKKMVVAKDLDHVLSEMTLLQARAELYYKFIRKRLTADIEVSTAEDAKIRAEKLDATERLITRSGLAHSMQDLLADYIMLEDYFMSQNVGKAIQHSLTRLDEGVDADMGDPSQVGPSLLLDDVFFLLKKCVQRAIGGHNVDGVCAVVNNACRILEQDFCGTLQGQLKMGFPTGYLDLTHAYNVLHSSYQQGKLQGGDTERQKQIFLTALNNCDSAGDYVTRLTASLKSDSAAMSSGRSQHDRDKLDNCLSGLPAVNDKLRQLSEQGLQQLRQSVVKPRVKPWMDSFASHDIGEEEFADYEANDPFVQTLILNLDGFLGGFKRALTPTNYDALVSILTSEVTAQLEKAVLRGKFSRLGGLMLDREVRSLVSFLTGAAAWGVRDRFARLTQMSTLLNLEDVSEMTEVWAGGGGGGGVTWRLTPAEARQLLNLRTDFKPEDVKRLRL